MEDYTNLFVVSVLFTLYVILLNNNKVDNIKTYLNTQYGKMLVILLILLSLQKNIQIGLIITLAYILTVIEPCQSTQVESFKNKKINIQKLQEELQKAQKQYNDKFNKQQPEEKVEQKTKKEKNTLDDDIQKLEDELKKLSDYEIPIKTVDDDEENDDEENDDDKIQKYHDYDDNTDTLEGFSNFNDNYSMF